MEYRGDTDVPWRKRQLHRLTAPLLGKARQGKGPLARLKMQSGPSKDFEDAM